MSVTELVDALDGSHVLATLQVTADDALLAHGDADVLETLSITYDLLGALSEAGVIDIFFRMHRPDQRAFLRWIGGTDETDLRHKRTQTFVSALQMSPLGIHAADPTDTKRNDPPAEVMR